MIQETKQTSKSQYYDVISLYTVYKGWHHLAYILFDLAYILFDLAYILFDLAYKLFDLAYIFFDLAYKLFDLAYIFLRLIYKKMLPYTPWHLSVSQFLQCTAPAVSGE